MLTVYRQRGANWRNDGPGGPPAAGVGRIGAGDAVDREYEVSSLIPKPKAKLTYCSHL